MISIRKAVPDDAGIIIDFQKAMAWETEKLLLDDSKVIKGVGAVFENPSYGQYWIAEHDGKVVASLLITYEWSDWRNTNVWWFQSVYVIPSFRRKGIFRSMYERIRDEAEINGIAGLRLYVETNNERAQLTYESLGMHSEHYTMYEWLKD
jgi:GNAT superfamily N-acetyltransferase